MFNKTGNKILGGLAALRLFSQSALAQETLDQDKVSFRQEREGLTQLVESCPFAG